MALTGSLLGGLRLRPGSVELITQRFFVLVACFLPAYLAGLVGLADRYGTRPALAGHPGPLPVFLVADLLSELPKSFTVLAAAGVAALMLFEQVLSAGALARLDPERSTASLRDRWRGAWREGVPHFWRFVRIKLLAVVLFALGAWLIGKLFSPLFEHGERAGYTGLTLVVLLPGARLLATTLWLAVVGALAFWCRLLTVADDRRRVRRTVLHVLQVFRRRPWQALGFFVVATMGANLGGTALLVLLAPPHRGLGAVARAVVWLALLLAHSYVWHWLIHAGRLLYARPEMADVHGAPDAPWRRWFQSERRG